MPQLLWQPSPELRAAANLIAFFHQVEADWRVSCDDLPLLYRSSCGEPHDVEPRRAQEREVSE